MAGSGRGSDARLDGEGRPNLVQNPELTILRVELAVLCAELTVLCTELTVVCAELTVICAQLTREWLQVRDEDRMLALMEKAVPTSYRIRICLSYDCLTVLCPSDCLMAD